MEKHYANKGIKVAFVYCLTAILLFACAFLPMTSSWLTTVNSSAQTDGTASIPNPTVEFYNGTTLLTSAYPFTTGDSGNTTSLNIHIKNTSYAEDELQNAAARVLVRVFYTIYVDEGVKEIATTKHISSVTYGNYILTHDHLPNTYSGYLFVNGAIEPNTFVRLFTNIIPTEEGANKTFKLQLSAEALLYEGNPYSTGELSKAPWQSYPDNWLNLFTWDTDFESYADGDTAGFSNQANAGETTFGVATVGDAPVGNKVFSFITDTTNIDTKLGRVYRAQEVEQGCNYRFACYYKSTSTENKADAAIRCELNGNGYNLQGAKSRKVTKANSWEYITIETGLLDKQPESTTKLYCFVYGGEYETTWFDYYRLERIMGNSTPV